MAAAQVLMADYASVDRLGKLHVVGADINVVGVMPGAPLTSSFYVVVLVAVPPEGHGEKFAFDLSLADESGATVVGPGEAGQPVVQFSQTVEFPKPTLPEGFKFSDEDRINDLLKGRLQLVAGFPVGLPLQIGRGYQWRIAIDGVARDDWVHRFIVAEQVA